MPSTPPRFARASHRQASSKGKNVRIEYRWGKGDYSRLPAMAAELAAMKVAAIAATGDIASARAAKGATTTIPIVFTIGGDPVGPGLVQSLNRPGGNVTGGQPVLVHPDRETHRAADADRTEGAPRRADHESRQLHGARRAAGRARRKHARLGREAVVVNARKPDEIATALAEALRLKADSYMASSDPLILDRRGEIVAFGQAHRFPGVGFVRQFASAGALLSYGPSITWMYRQAGLYIGMILKGAKPAELPVVQPTGFELVLNLKTAAELGLEPPRALLLSANEVIE
jgi:putative ABC transport system substrate-binding protein